MEHMQSCPAHCDDSRCKAISELIDSVAEEQEALARILEAEHKKIEKTADLCDVDVEDLVKIDKSVERVLDAATRLKLALFGECLCPDSCDDRKHHGCEG